MAGGIDFELPETLRMLPGTAAKKYDRNRERARRRQWNIASLTRHKILVWAESPVSSSRELVNRTEVCLNSSEVSTRSDGYESPGRAELG